MDAKSKSRLKLPHMSWSGPQPPNDIEAYALAMVVRMATTHQRDRTKRLTAVAPSVLTIGNIHLVAQLYAFYCSHIREDGIRTNEKLLEFFSASAKEDVWKWSQENKPLVSRAEAELIDLVETEQTPGFRCYG